MKKKIIKKGWAAINQFGDILYQNCSPQIYIQRTKPIVWLIAPDEKLSGKKAVVVRALITLIAPKKKTKK